MAENNGTQTATPPANSGGLTIEQVNAAIAGVVKPLADAVKSLGDNQKTIADTLAQLPPAGVAKKDGEKPAAITADDVTRIVTDALKAQSQSQQAVAAREKFVSETLGKLPDAYKRLLGNDPAKWADEAKVIQSTFESDLKASGAPAENKGGASRDGGSSVVNQPIDKSKLDPVSRIAEGIKS